jgi:orotidine-5'-phosphate decarboxylase
MNIWAFTVHLKAGSKTLRWVQNQLHSESEKRNIRLPLMVGVTELTSQKAAVSSVMRLAKVAYISAMQAVVCSVWEARKIKEEFGLTTFTPGIRSKLNDDQKRVATVKDALKERVDFFIVGRPIVKTQNPLRAAQKILQCE